MVVYDNLLLQQFNINQCRISTFRSRIPKNFLDFKQNKECMVLQ